MLVPVPLTFVANKKAAALRKEKEKEEAKAAPVEEAKPAVRRRPKREYTLLQRSAVAKLQREAKRLLVLPPSLRCG